MIIMVLGREQGGPQWASIWRLKAQGGIAPPLLTPSISDKLHGLRQVTEKHEGNIDLNRQFIALLINYKSV